MDIQVSIQMTEGVGFQCPVDEGNDATSEASRAFHLALQHKANAGPSLRQLQS